MDQPADADLHHDRPAAVSPAAVSWALQADPTLLTDLRTELRGLFTSWAVSEDAGEDALLVISELIANVIDHAGTPFRLTVHPSGDIGDIGATLQVAVEDGSTALPVQQPQDPYAARGRGLQIVDRIAIRWGYQTHHNGKTVWATLDLASPPADH